jgi:type II restriction enzyme
LPPQSLRRNEKNHLKAIYPTNQHITDKIRQQLQFLRDLGLVEFLGDGKYKKLWK